jgi:CheY-like chemotaxis protein
MDKIKLNGIFVDDVPSERRILAATLSQEVGNFELVITGKAVSEISPFAKDIVKSNLDLVVLDFRLDHESEDNQIRPEQGYKGSGLAQHLRDEVLSNYVDGSQIADFPVFLISSESNIENYYKRDKTAHDLFDCFFKKEDLDRDDGTLEKIARKMIAISNSYKFLNESWAQDKGVEFRKGFFNGNDFSNEIINNQEIKHIFETASAPHILVRFVLNMVMRKEGFLYSIEELSAKIGTNAVSLMEEDKILEWLGSFKYRGELSFGWERWWSFAFERDFNEILGGRFTSLSASERVNILNERFGTSLEPAKSAWNNSSDEKFLFACVCCRRPTEMKHSLAIFDSDSKIFNQPRRICWDCVYSSRCSNYEIRDSDVKLKEKIESGSVLRNA